MRSLVACAALVAVATSCTHHQNIAEGNFIAGEYVEVETQPGAVEGGHVSDDGTKIETERGTFGLYEVQKVTVIKRFRGGMEGLGLGFLAGATAGAIYGYTRGDDECASGDCFVTLTARSKAVLLGFGFGCLGGLLGLFVGLARGSRDVYNIGGTNQPQPAPRVTLVGPPGSTAGVTVHF